MRLNKTVILDSSPLGMLAGSPTAPRNIVINRWLRSLDTVGWQIILPEIADYKIRRELLLKNITTSIARLDALKASLRYLPITTDAMLLASDLWARARQAGVPTADAKALDGDVILCAQVLTLGLAPGTFVVATSNINHITRYVPADAWSNIQP